MSTAHGRLTDPKANGGATVRCALLCRLTLNAPKLVSNRQIPEFREFAVPNQNRNAPNLQATQAFEDISRARYKARPSI